MRHMDFWRPKILSMERIVIDGGQLPRGYGIAWWLPLTQCAYCLPIPLNKIVGSFRNWYIEWSKPAANDSIMAAYNHGRHRGYQSGYDAGLAQGMRFEKIVCEALSPHLSPLSAPTGSPASVPDPSEPPSEP